MDEAMGGRILFEEILPVVERIEIIKKSFDFLEIGKDVVDF